MRRLLPLLALLLALLPSPARAWWEQGHQVVAAIAWADVQPRTRAAITQLLRHNRSVQTPTCPLRTIEQAAVWPDCVKSLGDRFSYAYAWHFQDVDICQPFDLHGPCAGGNCVSAQILRAQRMVADTALPWRDRVIALAFLVHFVGDLHQPLHSAEHDGDQGGNRLHLAFLDTPDTNLHAVWDGLLPERAVALAPVGAAGILGELSVPARAAMRAGTVEDWSRESWQLARDQAYASVAPDICRTGVPAHPALTAPQVERLLPVVRQQLARGGLRLARLLDEALDGDHPEVAHPPRAAKAG